MVAIVNSALDACLVEGHQGELNSYKEAGPEDEGKPGEKKNPFHLAHPSKGRRVQWG
ncbi:hypothetical protein D3C79_1059840 [compost metagenome]